MLSSLWQDARYGLRALRKQPGFTLVAVLSLALGIGLNTAIFTLVDALLFRPMPVAHPETLVSIFTSGEGNDPSSPSLYPDFLDLTLANGVFTEMVGHAMMFTSFSLAGQNRLALGEVVTANYFSALGIRPALGRGFTPDEDAGEGAHAVAVISDRLWRRSFNGRADVIGQTVTLKNRPYTIVGVAPRSFGGVMPGIATELWIPISMVADVEPLMNDVVPSPSGNTRLERRGARWLQIYGRLRPGVAPSAAEANLAGIMARLAETYPVSNRTRKPHVVPASSVRIHPMIDEAIRPAGAVVMAAVGLVLLIACANLANMLLARGAARTREVAVRAALGASRARMARQLAVEHALLAMIGGAAGLVLAALATQLLLAVRLPIELPIALTFAPDARVLIFTFGLSLLTGLAFGLLPAIRTSRVPLVSALKSDGALSAAPGRRFGLRHALVIVQVAVSLVLIVGGLLMTRSLVASRRIDPGFRTAGLAIASMSVDMHGYSDGQGQQFYDRAIERLGRLPGVQSVALAERMPFSSNIQSTMVVVDGRPDATPPAGASLDVTRVTPGYFGVLGLPIVEGRNFDDRDTPESLRVAIVNTTLAAKFWPGQSAVGKRLRLRNQAGRLIEIVGVVPTYKMVTVGEAPRAVIHFARSQQYSPAASLAVRTSGDAGALVRDIDRELHALEPSLVLIEARSIDESVATSMLPIRLGAALIGGLAGLAMLLAGLGLYGVIAFSVSRRTREIGIRMALGAPRSLVLRHVMREGLSLVAIGAGVGLVLAGLGAQALGGVLNGVTPLDPVSYAGALAALVAASLAASFIPARRAASVDPLTALRAL